MSSSVITDPWQQFRQHTRARIALGRAGVSMPTEEVLNFQLAHALARDAVHAKLDAEALSAGLEARGYLVLRARSAAESRDAYLKHPDLGRSLDEESKSILAHAAPTSSYDAAFVIADGLSAIAVERHAIPLLDEMIPKLKDWQIAPIVIATQSRVALGDEIGELLKAKMVAILIGERPGLSSPDSLGVYLTFDPKPGRLDSERNCISNIRPDGLSYSLASHKLRFLMNEARRLKLTGVALKDESDVRQIAAADNAR
ncbi:MAG: ethanolamine ammonia-lyase subunit EutC [Burkholderiales bacterium]